MNLLYIESIVETKTGIKKDGKPWVLTKFTAKMENQEEITATTFSSVVPKKVYQGELRKDKFGYKFDSKGEFDDAGSQEETQTETPRTAVPPPPPKATPPAIQPSTTAKETALKCAILYFSKDIPKTPSVSDKDIIATAQTFLNWLQGK